MYKSINKRIFYLLQSFKSDLIFSRSIFSRVNTFLESMSDLNGFLFISAFSFTNVDFTSSFAIS